MYKLYYELNALEVLNLTYVNYSRHINIHRYWDGRGHARAEPVGYNWSDLELKGIYDDLSAVFFSRIINTFVGILPTFYIREDEENYYLRVTQGSIIKWNYADSEYGPSENFSLTLSVGNIQRIMFGSKDDLKKEKPKNKPKQKKVIIPERQIVICRTI
jgi:hypothetical protein